MEQLKRLKSKREGWSELSETQKTKRVMGSTLPLTPHKVHRVSGWRHRALGQRWEERSLLCLPPFWCSKTHTCTQPRKHKLTPMTCIHIYLYGLEGGSDLALCAQPTRKWCSPSACFTTPRSRCGKLAGCSRGLPTLTRELAALLLL